jgi:electron transport complex protein RnfB
MHTVIEPYCTGCELCLPVCPVDCIALENVSGERTGWEAWSVQQAGQSLARYEQRKQRLARDEAEQAERLQREAQAKLADLPGLTKGDDLERKKAVIEAALARARAKRGP